MKEKFGFLRETTEDAIKAGIDEKTGLHRTGLDEYLKAIFPRIKDWIHDKPIGKLEDGTTCRKRPDYRSEKLKLIIEFDGVQHYQSPKQIIKDNENTLFYESLGYKVVRIPYFIQLTNEVVKQMFDVDVKKQLFNPNYPSLNADNGPANMCPAGIRRMAYELLEFPQQMEINLYNLWNLDNDYLTGASLLSKEIDSILQDHQIDYNYLFTELFKDEIAQIYDDVYSCHADVRDDLCNGNIKMESYYPIPHKDFYEMFYSKLDKDKIEDNIIELFHTVFVQKQKYCIENDECLNFEEGEL